MKKLLVLAAITLTFTACKKEKLELKDRLKDKLKKADLKKYLKEPLIFSGFFRIFR